MMEAMSSTQLSEWMAYDRIEPFGPQRDDLRAGVIASTVYNVQRTKRSQKVAKPSDFMLTFGEEGDIDPEEQRSILRGKIMTMRQWFGDLRDKKPAK